MIVFFPPGQESGRVNHFFLQVFVSYDVMIVFCPPGLESGESAEALHLEASLRARLEAEMGVARATMQEEYDELTRTMQEQMATDLNTEQVPVEILS